MTTTPPSRNDLSDRAKLLQSFHQTRKWSETLCEPLETEDYVVQSMPDASPAKWHMAHVSWFFETFLLRRFLPDYQSPFPQYDYLFNSYYNTLGARHCRPKRGLISRPTVRETYRYRASIDQAISALVEGADEAAWRSIAPLLELGIHHEQQHQELLLTDLKHMFAENPLRPIYCPGGEASKADSEPLRWAEHAGGLDEFGHDGHGFCFDNETPRHPEYLAPHALASRLITNGEYLEFIADGGYARPEFWLSAGWATVQAEGWSAPGYWEQDSSGWRRFSLRGNRALDPNEPVSHVSYFEADAFARWAGARLPTEFEWESAAHSLPLSGNFAESAQFDPLPARAAQPGEICQMLGDLWEWTRSQYSPYPGYAQAEGALGEYNGKFMCNQFVLRGGSCATPQSHIRATYRNFFPPDARWQFTGIRLAQDR